MGLPVELACGEVEISNVLDIRMRRCLAQNVLFFVDNENIIVITSWSADAALLSAGFWPAELVLSPGLVS